MTDSPENWTAIGREYLPGLLGIEIEAISPERIAGRLPVRRHHHAPNGFLHAGTIVTLADSLCGYGTVINLPEGANGFTTVELKTNFLGTVLDGTILAEAVPHHRGRSTQIWDATVTDEATGKTLALFRCTQMVLWPREA